MRVLQVNKFFYPHAGSETVLFQTRELLSERGHDVIDFAMRDPRNVPSQYSNYFSPYRAYTDPSRPIGNRLVDAATSVYSVAARRRLSELLEEVRPDVAHLHVVYHQLTLSIVDELSKRGIPIVMTMHDYKLACPAYVLYRDGAPCRLCVTGNVGNVVRHKCIKGSRSASVLAGSEAWLARHRRTYDKIDILIAPSAFAGRIATEAGIAPHRVRVIPNFLSADDVGDPSSWTERDPRFFYAGRLERVKGVDDLLAAFKSLPPEAGKLVIAGAGGELIDAVRATAETSPNIEFLGRIERAQVSEELRRSRAALLPSRWDENYPMSVLEARAAGVPVICTDRGGLPEMVADGIDGLVVRAGDIDGLRQAVLLIGTDAERAKKLGMAGRNRMLETNSSGAHYDELMLAYRAAIERESGVPS